MVQADSFGDKEKKEQGQRAFSLHHHCNAFQVGVHTLPEKAIDVMASKEALLYRMGKNHLNARHQWSSPHRQRTCHTIPS